jgi:hypothetical protein
MTHPLHSHQRQVHLDFHTSPFIPDVGSEFDAQEFARTLKEAHVNSVTVFAKCHHGMSYYPTQVGTQHPALGGRDLLGEQIEALHREGIRCPIYTTVAWEEDVARRFPEWRQMRQDGTFSRAGNADPTKPDHPGGWKYSNYLHPDYQDYIEAHIREIFAAYEVDGLFFDIVFFESRACWSESSIKFREKHGLLGSDLATQARFESLAQRSFSERFTTLINGLKKDCTIFYNSSNPIYTDAGVGVRTRHEFQTQWELESLPSGFWGYFHFPRLARALGAWGKPWLGMTGRFQKAWGDFGGVKPQPALEYECFRSQALGGANSVGDQLPPRGRLDRGAYQLIGAVFAQCAEAEPFYEGSKPLPQVGIIAPGHARLDVNETDKTLEGAVQMCEEAHYDPVVLDDACSFDGLELIILPDTVTVTPALLEKLLAWRKAGGKILFSHDSGFDEKGRCVLPDIHLQRLGDVAKFPTYWRAREDFHPDMALSDRVNYFAGSEVVGEGVEVLVDRVLPYFKRTDLTFCSHFQTPPVAEVSEHAAVLAGEGFVYFADPIFKEYRQYGNIAAREAWRSAMRRLIGAAPFGEGLPSTILSVPRRRGDDFLLTLLHYIPTRKALECDMIDERSSFAGEVLRLKGEAALIRVFGSDEVLGRTPDGGWTLPLQKGRLLLEVPGYFAK